MAMLMMLHLEGSNNEQSNVMLCGWMLASLPVFNFPHLPKAYPDPLFCRLLPHVCYLIYYRTAMWIVLRCAGVNILIEHMAWDCSTDPVTSVSPIKYICNVWFIWFIFMQQLIHDVVIEHVVYLVYKMLFVFTTCLHLSIGHDGVVVQVWIQIVSLYLLYSEWKTKSMLIFYFFYLN